MAVRQPDDKAATTSSQSESYNVLLGIDSVDRGISRINLKWVVAGIAFIMGLMVLLGFIFCLYSGIHHDKPRYFFLLANLLLSTIITAVMLFWLWRGTLSIGVAWYVFLQCFFLFFICITTDIFAWYAPSTAEDSSPTHQPPHVTTTTSTMAPTITPTHNVTLLQSETPWMFKP